MLLVGLWCLKVPSPSRRYSGGFIRSFLLAQVPTLETVLGERGSFIVTNRSSTVSYDQST